MDNLGNRNSDLRWDIIRQPGQRAPEPGVHPLRTLSRSAKGCQLLLPLMSLYLFAQLSLFAALPKLFVDLLQLELYRTLTH